MLLISFQNCSQGKFEIDETQVVSASKSESDDGGGESRGNGNGAGNGENGTTPIGIPTPPPVIIAPSPAPAPIMPTQAEIDAEIARKNRCKSAIKMPVITNPGDFTNKILNVSSGLSPEAGDVSLPNNPARPILVTIEASQGIDTSKFTPLDACDLRTRLEVMPSADAGQLPIFNSGIDSFGNAVLTAEQNGMRAVDRLQEVLQQNNSTGNNTTYTSGNNTIGVNFVIRQTQNGDLRDIRCAEGSIYYKFRVVAETRNLQQVKPNYPASTAMADVVMQTGWQVAKVEVANSCWKENNLTRIMAAASPASVPATNALMGTAAAADGEWAATVSSKEGGNGFVYIFRKVAGNWTFFQKFKGHNGNGTALTGIALKGNLLVVSSAGDGLYVVNPPRDGYPGRVFVYNLNGSLISTPIQTIENPIGVGTKFGSGIAVTPNGIAIGDSYNSGKAYLYNLNAGLYGAGSGGSRTPTATIEGSSFDGGILGFGKSLLSANGRLVVGAYDGNAGYAGSVHLFDISGGSFASRVSINAPAGITANGLFGHSLAFDGTALAVGAYDNATNGNAAGALVYYADFNNAANVHIIQGSAAEERFGVSAAFTGDSLYVGSRGGTGSSGTLSRYKVADMNAKKNYTSRVFVQRSHAQSSNGEGFSYSISVLAGASVPTIMVTAQTKDYTVSDGDIRSKAGSAFIYEVK